MQSMNEVQTKKRIIFVTGSMGRGGAERVISLLSDYYANQGWSVTIAMLLHDITDGYRLNPNVQIVDLSQKNMKAALAIPFVAKRLRSLIQDGQPDAVVSFMAQNTLICGIACAGLSVRLIASERIDPAMVHRNALYRSILNRIYGNCARTILQTKRAWSYFPNWVQKNSVIIPNPTQVQCRATEQWEKRIVTAGRLEDQKNHAMLIDAFAAFHKECPDYVLDIYGEGSKRESLEDQIHGLKLEDCISLRGSSPKLHEDIANAAMFVLSSDFEGLSNALLEAMMMGLPIISTNCAGADEAIQDGINGRLVPIRDCEALTKAMTALAEDEEKMRQLGKRAREDAMERYSVKHVIKQWAAVIEAEENDEAK